LVGTISEQVVVSSVAAYLPDLAPTCVTEIRMRAIGQRNACQCLDACRPIGIQGVEASHNCCVCVSERGPIMRHLIRRALIPDLRDRSERAADVVVELDAARECVDDGIDATCRG